MFPFYIIGLISGTGKTSCARVIANEAVIYFSSFCFLLINILTKTKNDPFFFSVKKGAPLLYVPLEVIMSKYFGESERLLGKVFSLANEIPNGAIIFLDEVFLQIK